MSKSTPTPRKLTLEDRLLQRLPFAERIDRLDQRVTQWMARWKRNGWQTANKQPVKNQDLWERLDRALADHQVEWQWVKGHAGHPENERADALANQGIPR